MIVSKSRVVVALALSLALVPAWAGEATAHHDVLIDMFVWWNSAYKRSGGFSEEAFARYFTPDAVLRVNGEDRCKGLAQWSSHFREIQANTEWVEIQLPFIDEFASPSGDRIFTHHLIKAREHGKESRERVMGYAVIRHGRIALINFVSVADAAAGGDAGKP
jgi:ketosteroid isomerase-like protein